MELEIRAAEDVTQCGKYERGTAPVQVITKPQAGSGELMVLIGLRNPDRRIVVKASELRQILDAEVTTAAG